VSDRPWYKRYGGDFVLGTMSLSLEEKGAYSICLDLIYDRGGPIPDEPRWLAGVCGVSVRKWSALRERLIESGKLVACDGTLSNARAAKELENAAKIARKLAENGAKGGNKSAENRFDVNKNSDLAEAPLKPNQKPEPEPDKIHAATNARDAWRDILDQATEAAGDALDPTSTGTMHAADLAALLNPVSGEPCTESEIIAAVGMVAARERRRGKKIRSWSWVREDAIALRDKRLNSENPVVEARQTGPPGSVTSIVDRMESDRAEARRRVLNG
jgi:uncharacterized protein YdaU (DUF1376 family)